MTEIMVLDNYRSVRGATASASGVIIVNTPRGEPHRRDAEVLSFPIGSCAQLHLTNPTTHADGEVKRGTEVVGIFPVDEALIRLAAAIWDQSISTRARHGSLQPMANLHG
jgi:hypothetical protein